MTFQSDRDVRFGDHAILDVGKLVSQLDAAKVVLICGQHAFEASGAVNCLPELAKAAQVQRWSDFKPNTDAVDLIRGLRVVEEFEPDVIVGIGGGSAMDMAKLLCAYQGITDETKLHEAVRGGESVESRNLKLILAPTTSGSGSEATRFAVVYIGEQKYSIAGPAMLPDTVILDPALTRSASPYQRATSGIDAVAQAAESLWASGATDESREFAKQALDVLVPALPAFVHAGDADSAAAMAKGSHLAGRAIDISRTTAAHAMAYGITKTHGLPHGHAVAMTLGCFIEAHGDATAQQLQAGISPDAHAAAMTAILAAFGADTPAAARAAFVALAEDIGLSLNYAEAGISDLAAVASLTAKVNVERMGNNPVRFSAEELTTLIGSAL